MILGLMKLLAAVFFPYLVARVLALPLIFLPRIVYLCAVFALTIALWCCALVNFR